MPNWLTDVLAGFAITAAGFIALKFFGMLDELRKLSYANRERLARIEGALSNGNVKENVALARIDADLKSLTRTVTDHVDNEERRLTEWMAKILVKELEKWKARYDLRPKEG